MFAIGSKKLLYIPRLRLYNCLNIVHETVIILIAELFTQVEYFLRKNMLFVKLSLLRLLPISMQPTKPYIYWFFCATPPELV